MSITTAGHRSYEFGEFALDLDRGTLLRDGEIIKLRPQSFEVLRHLVERHGRLVSKDELFESVWGNKTVTDDSITQCLIEIRKALGDQTQSVIQTVPRRGYVFEMPVSEHTGPIIGADEPPPNTSAVFRGIGSGLAGLVLLGLFGVALWWWSGESRNGDSGALEPVSVAASSSIAVLPFADMSSDQDQAYFSDGISEQILNVLTQIPELRVIARTSSFSFKDQNVDIADIAERLNVTHVLEGSVRKSGNRIRITAQLIDASTSEHLWSGTYDRALDDIFAIQDDIASAIVQQLKINILSAPPETQPAHPEAYRLYLLAVHQLNYRNWDLHTEIESQLRQAVQIDPQFAPAWRELSRVLWRRVVSEPSSTEEVQRTRDALKMALSLDPDDPAALAYQAWQVMDFDKDIERAARLFEHAVSIGPTNEHVQRAMLLFAMGFGSKEDAIRIGEYSVARNPLCFQCHLHLAIAYRDAGRFDDAEAAIRTTIALFDHGLTDLGHILLLKGQPQAALDAYNKSDRQQGWGRLAGIAMATHDLGQPNESTEAIAGLSDKPAWTEESPWSLAEALAWTGHADSAFAAIDKAAKHTRFVVQDGTNLLNLRYASEKLRSPFFKKLHSDPRWQQTLERFGISAEQLAIINFDVTLPGQ